MAPRSARRPVRSCTTRDTRVSDGRWHRSRRARDHGASRTFPRPGGDAGRAAHARRRLVPRCPSRLQILRRMEPGEHRSHQEAGWPALS